jgi:cell fate regulator YaaT (PSP1 superfamily)
LVGDHFVKNLQSASNLQKGDFILVEFEDCTEIAKVVENGEIANYLFQTHDKEDLHLSKFLRKLTEEDENQFKRNMFEEVKAREVFKEKIKKHNLDMKLVDVHWQFDRKKIYFYYTAEGRVDFRELAKDLAGLYKTRIELRQIGVRDEAKRVGGLGTCGREYCCVSFMNNFKRISSQSANEQNPAVSMSKLSGPCGKLKCCLSFETENN